MFSFFKKLLQQLERTGVDSYPTIQSFPNVGTDGEITIDCVIRPTAGTNRKNALFDKQANGGGPRIPAKRVGTLEVEIDEYGLCLRWKPGEVGNDSFRFPALTVPRLKPATDPTENGGNDCDVKPLENAGVNVQCKPPNAKVSGPEAALSPDGRARLPGSAAGDSEKG